MKSRRKSKRESKRDGGLAKLDRKANSQSRAHPLPLLSSLGHQEQYTKKLSLSDTSNKMGPTQFPARL